MRYQNIQSFLLHIRDAYPDNFCSVYVLCVPDDFERGSLLEHMEKQVGIEIKKHSAKEISLPALLQEICSPSLFSMKTHLILDEAEALKPKELALLQKEVTSCSDVMLTLASKEKKGLASFLTYAEKSGVVLDVTKEKPWEKKQRLVDQVMKKAQKLRKVISAQLIHKFVEGCGCDPATVHREWIKLLTFVGDKNEIHEKDLCLLTHKDTDTLWKIAEEIVFEKSRKSYPLLDEFLDNAAFHSFVYALRHHLQLGYRLAEMENKTPEELTKFFPNIWPKTLQKRKEQSLRLSASYFNHGLKELSHLELMSKDQISNYQALVLLFRAKGLVQQ